jgi:hypothetical protein
MVELALALLDIRCQAGGDAQRCQGLRRDQEHVRSRHGVRAPSPVCKGREENGLPAAV